MNAGRKAGAETEGHSGLSLAPDVFPGHLVEVVYRSNIKTLPT